MDETDKPDAVLKQVPLIKNPSFQLPKPITLNANYNQLVPNLTSTTKPPKLNLSSNDLQDWIKSIQDLKTVYQDHTLEDEYKDWLKKQQLKVAPGLDSIITPNKPSIVMEKPQEKPENDQEINELDKAFGSTKLTESST